MAKLLQVKMTSLLWSLSSLCAFDHFILCLHQTESGRYEPFLHFSLMRVIGNAVRFFKVLLCFWFTASASSTLIITAVHSADCTATFLCSLVHFAPKPIREIISTAGKFGNVAGDFGASGYICVDSISSVQQTVRSVEITTKDEDDGLDFIF